MINKISRRILFFGKKQINLINFKNTKNTKRELSTFNPRPNNEDEYNLAIGFLLGYFTGIMIYRK